MAFSDPASLSRPWRLAIDVTTALVLALLVFVVVWRAPTGYFGVNSDPRGCLLTSQSLLEKGTVDLGHYPARILQKRRITGHLEDGCYIGNSLLALPVVAFAKSRGLDVLREQQDRLLQRLLAGTTCALAAMLIYMIGRLFVPLPASLVISVGFSLGTPLASTLGTAYWSHNFCMVFELLALLLLLLDRTKRVALLPEPLAVCLFWAYVTRPAALLFTPVVLVYLLLSKPGCSVRVVCWLLIQLGIFAVFSLSQYHSLLPPYFLGARLVETRSGWEALYGIFLSPSRGLFIFSPFLLVVVIGCIAAVKSLGRNLLFCVLAGWIVLHCFILSWRMQVWWGGWCFGPRYMTDVLPGFLVLGLLWYSHATRSYSLKICRILGVLAVILIAASVWINTREGLYNTATAKWNSDPDVNSSTKLLFDWRYPQFLASPERNRMRILELAQETPVESPKQQEAASQ